MNKKIYLEIQGVGKNATDYLVGRGFLFLVMFFLKKKGGPPLKFLVKKTFLVSGLFLKLAIFVLEKRFGV